MLVRQIFLRKRFARVSPVFAALGLAFLLSAFVPSLSAANRGASTTSTKRAAAEAQYSKAQDLRATLNSKPAEKRTLAEYKQVVSSYRRVYLITPRDNIVPDALLAVAELYSEMGDRFGRSYYQSAVDSYQFLIHEYPANRYCQDALLRIGKLERDPLGDPATASKVYEEFLKRYPHSPRKREAQEALAEVALLLNSSEPDSTKSSLDAAPRQAAPADTRTSTAAEDRGDTAEIPRVRRIRTSVDGDVTRVTIDLEDNVQFTSARISHPDRIFFDLHAARLSPEVARDDIQVEGDLLNAVRVAQNAEGVVRVVLDVKGVKDYLASLANDPPQLRIDLYADNRGGRAALRAAKAKSENAELVADNGGKRGDVETVAARHAPMESGVSPTRRETNAAPGNKNLVRKTLHSRNSKPDLIQPVAAPPPTRDGQSTLTRALGLKIGRIVIDPGHGGHDTGTIGPTGLMEKDLCLDVALRLGKIIQEKLPGAEIIYTRSDDTFVPLEDRTRIANQAKADLFISIHANSSHDHGARGIETYYLNLKGTPEAMEVAARENAVSQESVHNLEDLVKQIARNEKVDESREFAEDIQDSLARQMLRTTKTEKNRGVRKAPFVVLIGADMPSILTEISFLSNPSDEHLLKQPAYRQRVAEGLYQGVVNYLQSLNSVAVNLPGRSQANRPAASAPSVEQSRNRQ